MRLIYIIPKGEAQGEEVHLAFIIPKGEALAAGMRIFIYFYGISKGQRSQTAFSVLFFFKLCHRHIIAWRSRS